MSKQLPIQTKLTLIVFWPGFLFLVLVFGAFWMFHSSSVRAELRQYTRLTARSLQGQSAALLSGQAAERERALAGLVADSALVDVRFFDEQQRFQFGYHNGQHRVLTPGVASVALPITQGFRFEGPYLDLVEPILNEGHSVGYLWLRSDPAVIGKAFSRYALFAVAALACYTLLILLLSRSFRGFLRRPLEPLVDSMTAVTSEQDYAKRVSPLVDDELANLHAVYNKMLAAIERRTQSFRADQEHLDFLAHHDPLTELANRHLLTARLEQSIAHTKRLKSRLGVLYIDLDRFKKINDSFGHDQGDKVLSQIAQRLQNVIRESDTAARIGGDEFVILVEHVKKTEDLTRLVQKFLREISVPVEVDKRLYQVTATIGVSLCPDNGNTVDDLLKTADMAMYEAKEDGRNGFHFYSGELNSNMYRVIVLEKQLQQALEKNQFELHYQPQFVLQTGQLIGFEALLRWRDPERGLVSPDQFVPLAEESGLIVPIGEWVLACACEDLQAIQKQWQQPLRMAINISARQFRGESLVQTVARALYQSGIEAQALEIELTESMVMGDVEEAIVKMSEIRRLGAHLAIDDFGTGYSSLEYLKRFPISRLKIDRTFVHELGRQQNDRAIVNSIIALGKAMELEVIAEGIETPEQVDFLCQAGCDQGQGYLLGRPLPFSGVPALLDSVRLMRTTPESDC